MEFIKLPPVLSGDPTTQLRQLNSYLYQMATQLQFALNDLDNRITQVDSKATEAAKRDEPKSAKQIYNEIQNLIDKV